MAVIQIKNLSFTYPGSHEPVFEHINAQLDSGWRLGLVGRNGRGKTTFLRLLTGALKGTGAIETRVSCAYFPYDLPDGVDALTGMRNAVAPFDAWMRDMDALIARGDEASIARWGELESRFASYGGYTIDEAVMREADRVGIDPADLARPFDTFSPGEQTRLKIAALFLRRDGFPLIDEPTNHLDLDGRRAIARYLQTRPGFILTSHDRQFLDDAVDHIMALQKKGVALEQGTYSSYRDNKRLRDEFEITRNRQLEADIARLQHTAREKADWSDKVESSKTGTRGADRGYVGHMAAKAMKRSLAIRARIDRSIEEKEALLHDLEYASDLTLHPLRHPARVILRLESVSFGYGERTVIDRLSLAIERGDRLAISGANGAGKTTLIKLITGQLTPTGGRIARAGGVTLSYMPQLIHGLSGTVRDLAAARGLDLSYFLMLLRKLDFPREAFLRDMVGFSMGQQKKVLLAAAMAQPAHLYVWDEPLNYIDIESREQVENMLAQSDATMVFIEHDAAFLKRIATGELKL